MFLDFLLVKLPQAVSNDEKDEDPETDVGDVSSPASLPAISLLSPKAMETAGRIVRFEEEQRAKAKVRQIFFCFEPHTHTLLGPFLKHY